MSLHNRKAIIIGAGHVGSHAGYALASQGIVEEIVYIDIDVSKAKAQALDIYDSTVYLPQHVTVRAGDYEDAADADILVVAAGPLPSIEGGQTRMDTLGQTVDILKEVIPGIKQSGFSGIIINISNPADVITHYIQNQLQYPPERIFSTSTTLDSARLRRVISEKIGIDQKSIYAYALGEHGESQMVPWSTVTVAGKPILELVKERPEKYGDLNFEELADQGRLGGWKILEGKGSTEFGIGASLAEVARAVLADEKRILPVSVLLNGEYGHKDVFVSVPSVIGKNGVEEIIELHLSSSEQIAFDKSVKALHENFELALSL
ncbi:L-lactate dehydrogenase [Anaerosporobacter sp.]